MTDAELIAGFTDLYWNKAAPWTKTAWRGVHLSKCPMDLWTYQEIIFETRPHILIETGSSIGGSALFFASLFEILLGSGHVITVDKDLYPDRPYHERIDYLTGDSGDSGVAERVLDLMDGGKTMVSLDSLHTYEHVKRELELYAPLVSPGCYLVVEDTGVDESWGKPAASAALAEFLADHPDFQVDRSCESQLLTLNPGGWVKRIQ